MTTEPNITSAESVLRKVRGLLAKAESTTNEAERDAYLAKAQQLQDAYKISSTLLAASGQAKREGIDYTDTCNERNTPLIKAKRELIIGLADLNNCTTVMGPSRAYIRVFGHNSDRDFVLAMFNSIMLQLQAAMARDEEGPDKGWRVSYAHGYVRRVYSRLKQAQERSQAENPTTGDRRSNALVLVDRTALVSKHMNDFYGDQLKVGRRIPTEAGRNEAGYRSGDAAGMRADLGGARVGGQQAAKPLGT
jgi:hypothetical protein